MCCVVSTRGVYFFCSPELRTAKTPPERVSAWAGRHVSRNAPCEPLLRAVFARSDPTNGASLDVVVIRSYGVFVPNML